MTNGTRILSAACILAAVVSGTAAGEFDVSRYGAVGDGKTLNTEAFSKAIDACTAAGGGTVVVPAGRYLVGTIIIKSNVELHLQNGATLLCSTDVEDVPLMPKCKYPCLYNVRGTRAFIYAEAQSNIALTGSGTIDGQGSAWKPGPRRGTFDERPRVILFVSCKDVRVEGIRLRNSPAWMQHYLDCDNVRVHGIDVFNHANMNSDGIDIDGCRNVRISDSVFDADDDGICLKSTGPAACEDIVITNCVASSHCNAIKTGTESTGGFKRVTISNCTVKPSANKKVVFGFREGITGITVGCVDGGICEDIKISDITIEGTRVPIFVRLGKRNRAHTAGAKVTKDSTMSGISISNITATGAGDWGCSFLGLPGNPIKNLQLHDINITFSGGGTEKDGKRVIKEGLTSYPQPTSWGKLPVYGVFVRNADKVSLQNLDLRVAKEDQRSPVWLENVNGVVLSGIKSAKAVAEQPQVIRKNVTD